MTAESKVIDGRTWVQVRAVAEMLGATVSFGSQGNVKKVSINTNQQLAA